MRRVLVTGAHSYVGDAVAARLSERPDAFAATKLSLRDGTWRDMDLSAFDAIFHVAGIAHVSTAPDMEELYLRVNRDLTVELADAAKRAGVAQFVFMSSSIVYGDSTPPGVQVPITRDTPPAPANFYGKSKLEAEEGLRALEGDGFAVAVLRCPMVYGPGCTRGNFPTLVSYARRLPLFFDIDNRRSMLYLGNLVELVEGLLESGAGGLYLPQNAEHVRTSELVRLVAEASGRRLRLVKLPTRLVRAFSGVAVVRKAFGNLFYAPQASECGIAYQRCSLEQSVREIAAADGW